MKYTVKMGCGHDWDINTDKTGDDLKNLISYLEKKGKCSSCTLAAKRANSTKNNTNNKESLDEQMSRLSRTRITEKLKNFDEFSKNLSLWKELSKDEQLKNSMMQLRQLVEKGEKNDEWFLKRAGMDLIDVLKNLN